MFRNIPPEEVVRQTAERWLESKDPKVSFAGRIALLQPLTFESDGQNSLTTLWAFEHEDMESRTYHAQGCERLLTGKRAGKLCLNVRFHTKTARYIYNGTLWIDSRPRSVTFHAAQTHINPDSDKKGFYEQVSTLAVAVRMIDDINYGVMTTEDPKLQQAKSRLETYKGDDARVLQRLADDVVLREMNDFAF